MEHHANLIPWQELAARTGATLRVIPLDDDGALRLDAVAEIIGERTKLVAFTHVSNVLGVVNPVEQLVSSARAVGALVVLDACQSAPHLPLDVRALDVDFAVISGHKMLGPTGIGALYGRRELLESMPPFIGGGSMISKVGRDEITWAGLPAKFEGGTPAIAEAVGFAEAVRWVDELGLPAIHAAELELTAYGHGRLAEVDGLRLFGPPPGEDRGGILSFELEGVHPHDVSEILDRHGVAIRAGHHCAQPLMERLGVPATSRASLAVYNTRDEIDRLVEGLSDARRVFQL
jgi:cysteine desulfurase/selenocysteine lyase